MDNSLNSSSIVDTLLAAAKGNDPAAADDPLIKTILGMIEIATSYSVLLYEKKLSKLLDMHKGDTKEFMTEWEKVSHASELQYSLKAFINEINK